MHFNRIECTLFDGKNQWIVLDMIGKNRVRKMHTVHTA